MRCAFLSFPISPAPGLPANKLPILSIGCGICVRPFALEMDYRSCFRTRTPSSSKLGRGRPLAHLRVAIHIVLRSSRCSALCAITKTPRQMMRFCWPHWGNSGLRARELTGQAFTSMSDASVFRCHCIPLSHSATGLNRKRNQSNLPDLWRRSRKLLNGFMFHHGREFR